MSSVKYCPFCLGLNEFKASRTIPWCMQYCDYLDRHSLIVIQVSTWLPYQSALVWSAPARSWTIVSNWVLQVPAIQQSYHTSVDHSILSGPPNLPPLGSVGRPKIFVYFTHWYVVMDGIWRTQPRGELGPRRTQPQSVKNFFSTSLLFSKQIRLLFTLGIIMISA